MTDRINLRELKKQRTRNALLRTALELFTTQGFDRTTVDEIADACGVSQRTFFRYFANKEEVALAVQQTVESRFVAALHERPLGESPFEALRRTVLGTWDAMSRVVEELIPLELHMRTYQMIESTPPCSPFTCAAPSNWKRNSRAWSPNAKASTWTVIRGRVWPSPPSVASCG